MPSLGLFILWFSILFFPIGYTQDLNDFQDFNLNDDQVQDLNNYQDFISNDDQSQELLGLSSSISSEGTDYPGLEDLSDTGLSDFGENSNFADVDISDFNDPDFSTNILEASCSSDDGIRSGKLRARQACANRANIQLPSISKPSSRKGDAVGTMTSNSYWCVDLQFALYHTVPVCDELYTGADLQSSYHHVVYPSRLSKFYINMSLGVPHFPSIHPWKSKMEKKNTNNFLVKPIEVFQCPEKQIYCCAEWIPNSVMTSVEIAVRSLLLPSSNPLHNTCG